MAYKMIFTIKSNSPCRFKINVYKSILYYPFSASDIQLDRYLRQNLKIDLKTACIRILHSCKWTTDKDGNYTVTTLNKYYNDLATLITYGNEKTSGSNILKFAFGVDR